VTKKVRSKANPRNLVFTIGFSAGGVGLAMAKGPKQRFNGNAGYLIYWSEVARGPHVQHIAFFH
jgi:hypothetical protein